MRRPTATRCRSTSKLTTGGGAAAAPFTVELLLSDSNTFRASSTRILQAFPEPGLAAGGPFTQSTTVTLPDAATARSAGLPALGPVFLGLRIDPSGTDANSFNSSGVHRGLDWEQ